MLGPQSRLEDYLDIPPGGVSPGQIAPVQHQQQPQQQMSPQLFNPETKLEDYLVGGGKPSSQGDISSGEDFYQPIPIPDERYTQELETSNLHRELNDQRGTLAYIEPDEKVPEKEKEPGTLAKVWDILLRPNYATAGMGMHLAEGEGLGGLGSAAWKGLKGETKNTFSDVLEETGVENRVVKGVGGFILDVALDPTTYIGVGVVKSATKGTIQAATAKAASEVLTSPVAQKSARLLAENQVQRELLEGLGKQTGKKKAAELTTEAGIEKRTTTLADKILKEDALREAELAKLATDTAGKVSLKFAGKTLGASEGIYTGVSRMFKPIREMAPVDQMNRWFRPKADLGDMHGITRYHEGRSIWEFEDSLKFFKEEMMAPLNKGQREAISHALEGTVKLTDPQEIEAMQHVQRLFKEFFDAEVKMGIHGAPKEAAKKFRENYVYHMFNVDQAKATAYKSKMAKNLKGDKKAKFTKERTGPNTLEAAEKAGMKPVTDIQQIVQERAAKHYQEMTYHSIMQDGMKNYGAKVGTKEAKKLQEALGDLGTGLEKFTFNGETRLFPKEIVRNLEYMRKIHNDPNAANGILRQLDKAQRGMKFWMTVANPGHHIRNFTGNAFMAYQDGVRNPNRYRQALAGVRGAAAKRGSPQQLAAKNHRIKVGDGFSNADEMMQLYGMAGAKSGFYDTEVAKNSVNKASNIVRKISTGREDTARLGHFIDVIAKSKPKGWSKMTMAQKAQHPAVRDAAQRVRKFQLDYGDLTAVEKNVARRLMMFYTFARKNTALQVEMLFTRPGKTANVKKAYSAIETMLGVDKPALEDEDLWERIPEWVQVMGGPQIGGNDNFVQRILGNDDPVYGNMLLPVSDLNRLQKPKGTAQDFFGEIRPELKIPMEQAFGSQAYSGAPTPTGAAYVAQQLPITNLLRKIIGNETTNTNTGQDIFNWLSGLSTQSVTPQRQQSELRRQQQPVQERIRESRAKTLEDVLEEIRDQQRRAQGLG